MDEEGIDYIEWKIERGAEAKVADRMDKLKGFQSKNVCNKNGKMSCSIDMTLIPRNSAVLIPTFTSRNIQAQVTLCGTKSRQLEERKLEDSLIIIFWYIAFMGEAGQDGGG